jgi:hypothetical protein
MHNGKGKSSDIEPSSSDREVGESHSHQTPKRTVRDVSPTASDFSADGLDREMGRRLQPVNIQLLQLHT